MMDETLLEEIYAPDQYGVLVTCIFLNETKATQARPKLEAFLKTFPTPKSLRDADPKDIAAKYFKNLGLHRRAWWLVRMAEQLLDDPPMPNKLRLKSYKDAGYASEVAHLTGIGDYGSDAWRLFCKKPFYEGHGLIVADEWRTLEPRDKDLKRYVARMRREEQDRLAADLLAASLAALQLALPSETSQTIVSKTGTAKGSEKLKSSILKAMA